MFSTSRVRAWLLAIGKVPIRQFRPMTYDLRQAEKAWRREFERALPLGVDSRLGRIKFFSEIGSKEVLSYVW
jgi:hypothetical protein